MKQCFQKIRNDWSLQKLSIVDLKWWFKCDSMCAGLTRYCRTGPSWRTWKWWSKSWAPSGWSLDVRALRQLRKSCNAIIQIGALKFLAYFSCFITVSSNERCSLPTKQRSHRKGPSFEISFSFIISWVVELGFLTSRKTSHTMYCDYTTHTMYCNNKHCHGVKKKICMHLILPKLLNWNHSGDLIQLQILARSVITT